MFICSHIFTAFDKNKFSKETNHLGQHLEAGCSFGLKLSPINYEETKKATI